MTAGVEAAGLVRSHLYELTAIVDRQQLSDEAAVRGRKLHWVTDCKSLFDNLSRPSFAKTEDKRLPIDLANLRQ